MAEQKVAVTAAEARAQMNVRLYVLALIALARQLQDEQEKDSEEVVRG